MRIRIRVDLCNLTRFNSIQQYLTEFNSVQQYSTYRIDGGTRMARVVRTQKVRQLYLFRDHLYLALTPTALTLTISLNCVREERKEMSKSSPWHTTQRNTTQHNTTQHRMVLYNKVLSSITQQNTLQHCTTQER